LLGPSSASLRRCFHGVKLAWPAWLSLACCSAVWVDAWSPKTPHASASHCCLHCSSCPHCQLCCPVPSSPLLPPTLTEPRGCNSIEILFCYIPVQSWPCTEQAEGREGCRGRFGSTSQSLASLHTAGIANLSETTVTRQVKWARFKCTWGKVERAQWVEARQTVGGSLHHNKRCRQGWQRGVASMHN